MTVVCVLHLLHSLSILNVGIAIGLSSGIPPYDFGSKPLNSSYRYFDCCLSSLRRLRLYPSDACCYAVVVPVPTEASSDRRFIDRAIDGPLVPSHRRHHQTTVRLSVCEMENRRECILAQSSHLGRYLVYMHQCYTREGISDPKALTPGIGGTDLPQTEAALSECSIGRNYSWSRAPGRETSEMLVYYHSEVDSVARKFSSVAEKMGGLLLMLLIAVAALIRLLSHRPRHSFVLSRRPRLKDLFQWLYLSLAVCSSAAKYSNTSLRRNVDTDFVLQSQTSSSCFSTTCGSSYQGTTFPKTTCYPGAYVYSFTVTTGSNGFNSLSVNELFLTCSDGKTLSQGLSPPIVNNTRLIMSRSGFNYVELDTGCILDHMRIDGVDVGNVTHGTLSPCTCPVGASIVGLPADYFDPYIDTSFSSFGIICDNTFCEKGQYYSNGKCLSCPSGCTP